MSIFNKHAHQERPYIVIVDIDGTISEATEDRLHLLPPPGKGALTKDWNEFNLACDTDRGQFGYRKLLYYKGFPGMSTPVL